MSSSLALDSVALGGDASNIEIAQMGFGTMHFTWIAKPQTKGTPLEVLKAAVDAAAPHKVLFNCGAF